MRFEVPQFIDVEDKIFGPFTWRQFLYLGGGVGMAVVLFFTTNIFVFVLIGLPLGLIAGALAFYPVNNRPFSFFLESIFNYITKQKLYLWRQQSDIVYKSSTPAKTTTPQRSVGRSGRGAKKDITSMARRLELQALQKNEQ